MPLETIPCFVPPEVWADWVDSAHHTPDRPNTNETAALPGSGEAGGTSKGGDQDDEGTGSYRALYKWMEQSRDNRPKEGWDTVSASTSVSSIKVWCLPDAAGGWILGEDWTSQIYHNPVRVTGRYPSVQPPDHTRRSELRWAYTNLRSFLLACMGHLTPSEDWWIVSFKVVRNGLPPTLMML